MLITGQHDDARMCLALAVTAVKLGAAVANYTEVTELIKTSDSIVAGAKVKDRITGTPIICVLESCVIYPNTAQASKPSLSLIHI